MPTSGNALNITSPGITIFDGTATFSATTTTQYNTLVGGAGNTIVSITPGTAGWLLTSQGAATNPIYAAPTYTPTPWTDVTATTLAAVVNNSYFFAGSSACTATLPASPAQGNTISFTVDENTVNLTIAANTGHYIRIGKTISAVSGIAVSNFIGDHLTLTYRASDTTWHATAIVGTWSIT